MQHAEVQAAVGDVSAVQVKATNDPDKPVDLQLWGAMSSPSLRPGGPRAAFAIVTIDAVDQNTRYKVWFRDEVYTYITGRYGVDNSGGSSCRVRKCGQYGPGAAPEGFSRGQHLWLHPVRVPALPRPRPPVLDGGAGHVPAKAELRIYDRLSELDELIGSTAGPLACSRT